MDGTWIEVRVITKSEALEPVSGIFYSLDCKGVAIEDPNDILGREQGPLTWDFADINVLEHKGRVAVVKGYFAEEDNIEDVLSYVNERLTELKEMGIDLGEAKVEYEKMHEEDWANTWKQYYKPSKVGEKNVVKPIWEEYEANDGELVVDLDPGMAFGTGTHETTRMCIQALERYVKEESTVFDVGCGSGILAIAAAKLGAKLAIGVDLDPVAVESSIENVGYNNLNNIEILHGNLVEVIDSKAEIVVANILAEIICILTDDIKRVLKDNGIFITSGIIHDRVDMVCDKLEASGFEVIEKNRDGEWNCIVARLK